VVVEAVAAVLVLNLGTELTLQMEQIRPVLTEHQVEVAATQMVVVQALAAVDGTEVLEVQSIDQVELVSVVHLLDQLVETL
jgi:hypothetical protein